MLNRVSGVQVKKLGIIRGYIQFVMVGAREARSGIISGQIDENIVYAGFSFLRSRASINRDLEEIKKYVEDYNVKHGNSPIEKSPTEQVKELKELIDMGAISQEEFDKKKKELLNL